MKKIRLIFLLPILTLFACSAAHKEPTDTTVKTANESSYSFPHPANWASQHVEFYAKFGNKIRGSSKDCAKCHSGTQLSGSAKNISCGAQCHAQSLNPGQPLPQLPPISDEGKACLGCHADNFKKLKPHYPSAAGLCNTCHQATAQHLTKPKRNNVTTLRNNDNCYNCHAKKDTLPNIHPALAMGEDSCLNCHNPHGSEQRFFVKDKLDTLCVMCHDTTPENSKSVHGIIHSNKNEKSCTTCHNPHSSVLKKLLVAPKETLCLSCHDKPIQTTYSAGEARFIPNIKQKIDDAPHPHPGAQINRDNCTFCHSPHASENMFLLTKKYPDPPLAKYALQAGRNPNTYELCFTCHDPGMLEKDITAQTTGFRNDVKGADGKIQRLNLHWFHVVNAAGDQDKANGRSCYVCHDPHGSEQEHTIKTEWKLKNGTPVKIEYNANSKGGSCAKTCHSLHSYKRED